MHNYLSIAAVFLALALTTPAQAQLKADESAKDSATGLSVSTNYDYTTGSYGTAYQLPATTWSVGILWDINDNWSLDIDLPYLRQTSPAVTSNATVRVVRVGGKLVAVRGMAPSTNLQNISGQGDVTALLTRSFDAGTGPVWSLGAKVKFATASAANGLGTGKNDLSLQAGVIDDFGAWTLGATAGYTIVGRVEGLGLRNAAYLDLDSYYKMDERWSWGANMSVAQALVEGSSAPLSVSTSINYTLGKKSYLSVHVLRGLSDASPKWGAGLGLNLGF